MISFSNNKEIWMCIVHLMSFSILFCIQVMCSHDPIKGAGPPLWSPVYRELGACDPVSLFGLVATSQRPLVPRLGSRLKGAAAHGTHGGGTHWWGGRRQRWSNLVSGALLQHKNYDLRFETNTLEATGGTSALFLIIPYDYNCLLFWFSFRVFKARGMIAQNHLHSDGNRLWPFDHADYADYADMLTRCLSAQSFCFYPSQVCTWCMYKNEVECWFLNTAYIFGKSG